MESLIELELPEQIVESTEGGGLRPAVPVHKVVELVGETRIILNLRYVKAVID